MILASDFDNTLFFHGSFKEKDLEAIKKFQQDGHYFGVCTGRSFGGIDYPSSKADIHYDFYIVNSGGMVLNDKKEILFEKKVSMSLIKEIYQCFHINISIITHDHMYMYYHLPKRFHYFFKILFQRVSRHIDPHLKLIHSLDDIPEEEVNGFSFHFKKGEEEKAKECMDFINTQYSEYVNAFQNKIHIDVAPVECSKGEGIKIIKEYYKERIAGIGDSWNDLPMLDEVDEAYTFASSPDTLKEKTDYIVSDIAECIDNLYKTEK